MIQQDVRLAGAMRNPSEVGFEVVSILPSLCIDPNFCILFAADLRSIKRVHQRQSTPTAHLDHSEVSLIDLKYIGE